MNSSGAYCTGASMRELHTRCLPDPDNTIRSLRRGLPRQVWLQQALCVVEPP